MLSTALCASELLRRSLPCGRADVDGDWQVQTSLRRLVRESMLRSESNRDGGCLSLCSFPSISCNVAAQSLLRMSAHAAGLCRASCRFVQLLA